ncbi:hypothetical protein BDZ91DRAFT_740978 [Kalaharituber pfeilii]|nr:hypothetical protein BDZ91DRAFT_740978 [Kalaharituber pfeilii]
MSSRLITLTTVAISVVGGTLSAPILAAIGFTTEGVAAGSMAALVQARIGNVAAGSLFAWLQSIGATGVLSTIGPVFAAALSTVTAAWYGLPGGWFLQLVVQVLERVGALFL